MRYELGILTTGTASGAAAAEIRAGTSTPLSLLELGIFLNAATATILQIGRPGNTPAGGTAQTATKPTSLRPSGGASLGGIILASWTTAPTVPAAGNNHRQISLPAAIGNGIVFSWQIGEMIISPTTADGMVIWNSQLNSALRIYMKWDE
jgi:hypothetical protein